MCGICGIVNKSAAAGSLQINETLLKEMAQEVCHRGQDDEGYYLRAVSGRGPQVGFGHRRLKDNIFATLYCQCIYISSEIFTNPGKRLAPRCIPAYNQ